MKLMLFGIVMCLVIAIFALCWFHLVEHGRRRIDAETRRRRPRRPETAASLEAGGW